MIDDRDRFKESLKLKLKALSVSRKQELIAKMRLTKNEELRKILTDWIPSTNQSAGSVPKTDGSYELVFDNIKIIVIPDAFKSDKPPKATGAFTDILITPPVLEAPSFSKPKGGQLTVTAPKKPQFVYTIQTFYGTESGPRYKVWLWRRFQT